MRGQAEFPVRQPKVAVMREQHALRVPAARSVLVPPAAGGFIVGVADKVVAYFCRHLAGFLSVAAASSAAPASPACSTCLLWPLLPIAVVSLAAGLLWPSLDNVVPYLSQPPVAENFAVTVNLVSFFLYI